MDEPTSSISDKEVGFLFDTMRTLTKKGVGIIYISHKMSELEEICDRVTVMRDGQSVGTRVVKETNKDDLIALMVGRELTNYYTRDFQKPGEVILKGEHIADGKMVKDASFELHKGEIVGFAGLVGAGWSETMKAVFGLTPDMKGEVYVEGQQVHIKSPIEALKYGIALVPESRKEEGLYLVQDVQFNSTIEVLGQFIKNFRVNYKKEEEITQKYIDMMNTKTPSQQQVIGNLSGGNQQKVMIGRWLATDPKILILDEPTRGVDVGAKAEIYAIMNELVKKGMSIIMISSEMPEIINMSDRVYVMNDGRVTGCLDHEDVTQEKIMQLAAK
jgi:ribose transport system ATP-binding protein